MLKWLENMLGLSEDQYSPEDWFERGCRSDPEIGLRHSRGDKSDEDAARAYAIAARRGYAPAQYRLGHKHYWGKGVPEDDAEAAKWFRRSAEQEYALAQFMVAECYAKGVGVPEDDAEAEKWYRRAAKQYANWYREAALFGHAPAQFDLGCRYLDGSDGVPQDYTRAYGWLNLAASRFSTSEQTRRNEAVEMRDRAKSLLTPRQLAQAQRWARQWQPGTGTYPGRPCPNLAEAWESHFIPNE